MTAEEIFKEVLKSPVLQEVLKVPREELEQMKYEESSAYKEVEIVKAIIRGESNNTEPLSPLTTLTIKVLQVRHPKRNPFLGSFGCFPFIPR